jgi:hypothetical protein
MRLGGLLAEYCDSLIKGYDIMMRPTVMAKISFNCACLQSIPFLFLKHVLGGVIDPFESSSLRRDLESRLA